MGFIALPEKMQQRLPCEGSLYYCISLNIKSVVAFIAVQAQLLAAGQTNPVGTGGFTAAVAGVGVKEPCLLRQADGGFLHIEHLFRLAALVVGK